jgi:SH3-like domain-containing protein
MSLGERLREMLDPGASAPGSPPPAGPPQRRRPSRSQAQPVHPVRSYDTSEPARPMPRAQWIGLGLAAALAVALTAGLVFAILTITRPSSQPAVPTPAAVASVSPTPASSVNDIFNRPTAAPSAQPAASAPTATAQIVGQRLQIANTGGDGVNLRRDPGQAGDRIKTLPEGSIVEIVGPDQNMDGTVWRNVRDLQGDVGWVAGGFLAVEGSAPIIVAPAPGTSGSSTAASGAPTTASTPAPKPTSPGVAASTASRGQVGNTSGQGANIRSEPGSSGKVLKTLPEGSNLDVVGPDREVDGQIWRQVRDSSGVTGWIIRGAVAPAGSVPTPAPAAAPKPTSGSSSAPAATQAPAAPKPTSGSSGAPAATQAPSGPSNPQPTAGPTKAPGNLPIIIQPATPRPSSGTAPAPKPQASPAP